MLARRRLLTSGVSVVMVFASTILIAYACGGTPNYYIQEQYDGETYYLHEGDPGTPWAIIEPHGEGCPEDDYWFRLVNVTDTTHVDAKNSDCSDDQVMFDDIDQYSWWNPTITWLANKTYRLELYRWESGASSCVESVTFYTKP